MSWPEPRVCRVSGSFRRPWAAGGAIWTLAKLLLRSGPFPREERFDANADVRTSRDASPSGQGRHQAPPLATEAAADRGRGTAVPCGSRRVTATTTGRQGQFLVSTDDAYVQAHSVLISPKVSGYISEVPVDDNQAVKAGQVLARIDPRDYQTALDQARANVAAAQASIDNLDQQIAQQKLVVEQAQRQVATDQAALVYSRSRISSAIPAWRSTGCGTVQRARSNGRRIIREKTGRAGSTTARLSPPPRSRSASWGRSSPRPNAPLAQQQAMRATGRAQPQLHDDHGAGRWHGRRRTLAGWRSMCRPGPS